MQIFSFPVKLANRVGNRFWNSARGIGIGSFLRSGGSRFSANRKNDSLIFGATKPINLFPASDLIFSRMASSLPAEVKAKLDKIPDAKIDESGRFKYILIKVFATNKDGKHLDENSKLVVRGRKDCEYHADIYDKFHEEVSKMEGIDDDVLGGGRIERKDNKISVFGYSQGYGRADHTLTVEILKRHFPSHEISWSNDGY